MITLSAPLHVGISVTNRCNLKCRHCIYSSGAASENELSAEEIHELIGQVAEMGCMTVEFLGGEPFFHKDLNSFVEHAGALGLKVVVNTNGTLLTTDWIDRYAEHLLVVKISFDGAAAAEHDAFRGVPGAFERTRAAIRALQERSIDTCLITTVHRGNLGRIEAILSEAASLLQRGTFTVTVMMPLGRGEQLHDDMLSTSEVRELSQVLGTAKHKYASSHPHLNIKEELPQSILLMDAAPAGSRCCTAGISQMGISADGFAYPCTTMVGYRYDDHDVRKHRLVDIWRRSHLFCTVRDRQSTKGKCATCKHLNQCGGGCRYAAWAFGNGLQGEDPLCWLDG